MKARILILSIGAVVATVVLLLLGGLGVPVAFALSWLVIVLTVVLVSRQVFFDDGSTWPPEQRRSVERASEVSRLAWSINSRTGVAGHVVVRRMQNVLRRRLARRGLDLEDPAQHVRIDALLGPGVRDLLHRREVLAGDLERVLDAIEVLATDASTSTDRIPTGATADTEENR